MNPVDGKDQGPGLSSEVSDKMTKYGITRVPVDYFYYGRYRYTTLDDAVAEAKRDQAAR